MSSRFSRCIGILIVFIIICVFWNLNMGYINLSWNDFFCSTCDNHQIAELRINRVLAMLLAGIAVPSSGFVLQEYFQNPLAGPSVLGITSSASLAVAFYIFLSKDWILPDWSNNSLLAFSAIGGSILMMLILLSLSHKFQDKTYLIIFGFLISALSGAVVSILQFFAENQSLKNYVLWSFGANNQVTREQIGILSIITFVGLAIVFKTIKPLIGNSLGTAYAKSMGVNLNLLKYLVIISTSLLSAGITAFLGPILFIGIVVPHFSRMLFSPAKLWHQWILNMVIGMGIMLAFSIASEWSKLPINIITSLFGIPVILTMMLKRNKNF